MAISYRPSISGLDAISLVSINPTPNGLTISSDQVLTLGLSSAVAIGALSSADWSTFNSKQAAGNYITALTGDATASGPGSVALTLATVNGNVGSFGSSTSIPSFTVNAKGLITAASGNAVIAPAGTLSGTTLNATVVSSSLTSVGTITSGTWNGTTIAIANGGTGQTTKAPAFDALSPMSAGGDLIYGGASGTGTRLPNGTAGQHLISNGGTAAPSWSNAVQASSMNAGALAGLRNVIINGDMRIDARNNGAAQTITAAAALAYTVDRFYAYCTGANVTGQRVAGTLTSQYRYQFTGAASVTAIGFGQRISTANSYFLNNGNATFSVELANSLLTSVTWTVYRATTTADTFGTLASPTVTQIDTGTFTISSTITKYTATIALPSAAITGLQVVLTVGAQTSGTWTIGNFQLEQGSLATPFERRPLELEGEFCQFYLPSVRTAAANDRLPMVGSAATSGAISGVFTFAASTRVPVTGVVVSASGDFKLSRPSTGSLTASGISFGAGGMNAANIQWTVTGATVDQVYYLDAVNAGVIYFTGAEL